MFMKKLFRCSNYHIAQMFGGGKLWQISHQKLLARGILVCLLSFLCHKTLLKFGEPSAIRQGFPPPYSCYMVLNPLDINIVDGCIG